MVADSDWVRRAELHDLLRACRRRLPRPIRKGPGEGLRQADAAAMADLSLRAYANFERGVITPTPDVVSRVATALRMSDAERSALHILATQQDPPRPVGQPAPVPPREPSRALRDLVDRQDPYPAALTDEFWTVTYFNEALDSWCGGWYSSVGPDQRNMVLYLFSPHAETILPDVQGLRRQTVAAVRYQYTRNLASPQAAELVRRLQSSPAAAELWAQHELAIPAHEYPLMIRHGGQLRHVHVAFPAIYPWLWFYVLVLPAGLMIRRCRRSSAFRRRPPRWPGPRLGETATAAGMPRPGL